MSRGRINWGHPVNRACPLNRGLYYWFLFDAPHSHSGGNVHDLVRNSDGVPTNSLPFQPVTAAPFGWCVKFTAASSQRIAFTAKTFSSGTTPSTWAFWCKDVTTGVNRWMADRTISANATTVRVSSSIDFTVPSMGTDWKHVLVSRDTSNNVRVYVNGLESSTGAMPFSGVLTFSKIGYDDTAYYSGSMADVRLWERALSADEVYQLYADSRTGYQRTLNRNSRVLAYQPAAGGVTIPVFRHHYQMQGVA